MQNGLETLGGVPFIKNVRVAKIERPRDNGEMTMAPGPWQIAIIILVVLVFFGRGKISSFMGDLAKGITAFKKGLKEEDQAPKQVDAAKSADAPSVSMSAEKSPEKSDA